MLTHLDDAVQQQPAVAAAALRREHTKVLDHHDDLTRVRRVLRYPPAAHRDRRVADCVVAIAR